MYQQHRDSGCNGYGMAGGYDEGESLVIEPMSSDLTDDLIAEEEGQQFWEDVFTSLTPVEDEMEDVSSINHLFA